MFYQIYVHGGWLIHGSEISETTKQDFATRKSISFKHPEQMQIQHWVNFRGQWVSVTEGTYNDRNMHLDTKITFIRKDQPTCHTPHQELFNYMANEHNVTLLSSDIHEIIDIVGRIKEQGEENEIEQATLEQIALDHGLCNCNEAYTSRNMTAPDCPFHAFAVPEAMEAYAGLFRVNEQRYKEALERSKQVLEHGNYIKAMQLITEALNKK